MLQKLHGPSCVKEQRCNGYLWHQQKISSRQSLMHQREENFPGGENVTESCGISAFEPFHSSGFNRARLPRICFLILTFMFFIFTEGYPNIQAQLVKAESVRLCDMPGFISISLVKSSEKSPQNKSWYL